MYSIRRLRHQRFSLLCILLRSRVAFRLCSPPYSLRVCQQSTRPVSPRGNQQIVHPVYLLLSPLDYHLHGRLATLPCQQHCLLPNLRLNPRVSLLQSPQVSLPVSLPRSLQNDPLQPLQYLIDLLPIPHQLLLPYRRHRRHQLRRPQCLQNPLRAGLLVSLLVHPHIPLVNHRQFLQIPLACHQ